MTNNLYNNYPELSSEWDKEKNGSLSPKEVLHTSRKIVWWKCPQGHSWKDSVYHRTIGHVGCPVCSISPFISVATRCPSLVAYWDYSKNLQSSPESTSIGSRKRAFWKCSACSTSFSSVVSHMYSQFVMSEQRGLHQGVDGECLCPKCAAKQS